MAPWGRKNLQEEPEPAEDLWDPGLVTYGENSQPTGSQMPHPWPAGHALPSQVIRDLGRRECVGHQHTAACLHVGSVQPASPWAVRTMKGGNSENRVLLQSPMVYRVGPPSM